MRFSRFALALLAILGVSLTLRFAHAEGAPIPPAKYPGLTERIFNAKTENERESPLKLLEKSPRATQAETYGKVVGPVFRDRVRAAAMTPEARREMYATVIAHLADDQPEDADAGVLLVADFLPLLAADPKLVTLLRETKLDGDINNRKQGWARIMMAVQRLLLDKDPVLRRSAVRISAHCECVKEAETLAALYEALQQTGSEATPEDAAAYLDAAERLLRYRFTGVPALLKFLGDRAERFGQADQRRNWTDGDRYRIRSEFLIDVIDLYRAKGGEGIQKARGAALLYGQTLIAKADKPADLHVFFDPDREQFEELQRAAMAAAGPPRMKPEANAAWAALLVSALEHSDDAGVLDRVIKLIGETFSGPTDASRPLAAAVAQRLQRGAATDTLRHRGDLAGLLGRIGLREDVRAALPRTIGEADEAQKNVLARLIRAFGRVKDGLVLQITPYYRAAGKNKPPEWARTAVAQALGGTGFRASQEQHGPAALMLHHILTGEAVTVLRVPVEGKSGKTVVLAFTGPAAAAPEAKGEVLLELPAAGDEGPEASPAVISAAVGSLEFYPSADAAAVLGGLIRAGGATADTAFKILARQFVRGDAHAAQGMATLLGGEALPPPKRLRAVLDAIQQAPPSTDDRVRKVVAEAVRGVMARGKTDAVRQRAAGVAVHLADVEAVKPMYLAWKGFKPEDAARKVWRGLLQKLVVAVAHAGKQAPALDGRLAVILREISREGRHALVLGLFAAMGADANRFTLKRERADIEYEYAGDEEGRSREDRRKDLDAAAVFYRQLAAEAPVRFRLDMVRALYAVLVERAQQDWLATDEKAETFQLEALKVAAASGDAAMAKDALEQLAEGLRKSETLTAPQRSELAQLTKKLQEIK